MNLNGKEEIEMKKTLLVTAIVLVLVSFIAAPVFAAPGGKDNPANDNANNLYLYPKDSDWNIIWDGAWGKYNFKLSGTGADTAISGPFNGHGLIAGTEYSLIEYNGWWDVTVIGSAVADENGNVHIKGKAVVGEGGEAAGLYKIWLVPTAEMGTWPQNPPENWLFEHNLIPDPAL